MHTTFQKTYAHMTFIFLYCDVGSISVGLAVYFSFVP